VNPFCAVCVDGVEGLEPGEDGRLECARCRGEHPRSGGYSFEGGRGGGNEGSLNHYREGTRRTPKRRPGGSR
jgi:hypothetical protein